MMNTTQGEETTTSGLDGADDTAGPVASGEKPVIGGRALAANLRRSRRRQQARALALIMPLFLFIMLSFVVPILGMLGRSVDNSVVPDTLPRTVEALGDWQPAGQGDGPPEGVYEAFVADMQIAVEERRHTVVGARLNYERAGMSSLFKRAGRGVTDWDLATDGPFRDRLTEVDEIWSGPEIWSLIGAYSGTRTTGYYLNAVDAEQTADGIALRPEDERIYVVLFLRTAKMSLLVTGFCLLLGYPVAWLLANSPERTSNLLMVLVLLPFWTSLLVRTSAWKVLLQNEGVINESLKSLGLIDESLPLMHNQFGTVVAMTHILLPFMILPIYSVMKSIPPSYLRAARSLGASAPTAFRKVYLPQTVPGIGAGGLLVFILAIGYYITPAIVGGRTGIFISNRIAFNIQTSLNWGLAAALGAILLAAVMVLYWVYDRVVGIDNMKLG